MSRAFIKEDANQEDVQVAPRAPLPDGARNLVTQRGLDLLLAEREEIRAGLAAGGVAASDERLRLAFEAALDELLPRLASAELSVPVDDRQVRFGHEVALEPAGDRGAKGAKGTKGAELTVRIVGVDEADPEEGAISYLAPLAQALLGLKLGDEVSLGPSGRRMIVARIG